MRYSPRCAAMLSVVFDAHTVSSTDNSAAQHIVIVPQSASVNMNGYHDADTWQMEFDSRMLPFDVDSIAACNVRIFMWDDNDGHVGSRLDELESTASLNGRTLGFALDRRFGNFEMIRGITDEDEGIFVGDDNSIKLSGRDYTGILAYPEWDPKELIPTGRPLSEIVQEIADKAAPATSAARFRVVFESEDPIEPIVGSVHRSTKKKGMQVRPGKLIWDVIYDLVLQHGYIVYVRGSDIVITDPVTQTKQSLSTAPRLVYGKHLTKLSMKRKFGREKVPQILIEAFDRETGKRFEVVYPEKDNVIVDGLAVKKKEQMFLPAPRGIYDRETLKKYARIKFFNMGRGETEYTFETSDLTIVNERTGVVEADLLRFRPGAAIGIAFDAFGDIGELRSLKSVGERFERIRRQGYSNQVAQFVALNVHKITQFDQPYYLSKAKYDWDINDGIEIEMTGMNFANEVRETLRAEEGFVSLDDFEAQVAPPIPGLGGDLGGGIREL